MHPKIEGLKFFDGFLSVFGAFCRIFRDLIKKELSVTGKLFLKEARTGFEPVIRVLQTHALPLGYRALVTPTRFELVLPP